MEILYYTHPALTLCATYRYHVDYAYMSRGPVVASCDVRVEVLW